MGCDMKKVVLFLMLVGMTFAAHAQAGTWYFSFMPGFQFDSGTSTFPSYTGERGSVQPRSGLVASFDGEYLFTEHIGVHVGMIYNQGRYKEGLLFYPLGLRGEWSVGYFESDFGIIEVGPEYVVSLSRNDQVYFQANIGYTVGHDLRRSYSSRQEAKFKDGAVYGVAFGYRHFFGERTGIAAQLAYHRVDKWKTDHVDARVGVVFRF